MERVERLRTGGLVGTIGTGSPGVAGADPLPDQVPTPSPGSFVCVMDDKSRVLYANHTALTAFGMSNESVIGTSICRYVQARDLERVLVRHAMVLQYPGPAVAEELRFESVAHEARLFEIETSIRPHPSGVTSILMRGTARDGLRAGFCASPDADGDGTSAGMVRYDPFTFSHSQQVAEIAAAIADELQLDAEAIRAIEIAAAIHDIGEITLPPAVLPRPGSLSRSEFDKVMVHPEAGAVIASDIGFSGPVAEMIRQHHERIDGSGYPGGLAGDGILQASQIIAVSDVVSAMYSRRPSRPALSLEAALGEIETGCGRFYRTDIVDACLRLFRERGFVPAPVGVTRK